MKEIFPKHLQQKQDVGWLSISHIAHPKLCICGTVTKNASIGQNSYIINHVGILPFGTRSSANSGGYLPTVTSQEVVVQAIYIHPAVTMPVLSLSLMLLTKECGERPVNRRGDPLPRLQTSSSGDTVRCKKCGITADVGRACLKCGTMN